MRFLNSDNYLARVCCVSFPTGPAGAARRRHRLSPQQVAAHAWLGGTAVVEKASAAHKVPSLAN